MGKMLKIIIFSFLGLILIVVIVVIVIIASNPLRRSEKTMRKDILELAPIGSSMDDVIKVIESNNSWKWKGYIAPIGYPIDVNSSNINIGEKSIRAELGQYQGLRWSFLKVHVTVFWGFDENDKLIDVRVWKS